MLRYVLLLITILLTGCTRIEPEQASKGVVSPVGGLIVAFDSYGLVAVEAIGSSELVIRNAEAVAKCEVSAQIEKSWAELKKLCFHEPKEQLDRSLDPNEAVHGVVLAFFVPTRDGRFQVGYLRSEEDILAAASASEIIFKACNFDRRLEYRVISKSGR